jgi:rubrerythrin
VTWLIEIRALEVYDVYKSALLHAEIASKLEGLLAEETGHLSTVEAALQASDPDFATHATQLKASEAAFYQTFISALARELASTAA